MPFIQWTPQVQQGVPPNAIAPRLPPPVMLSLLNAYAGTRDTVNRLTFNKCQFSPFALLEISRVLEDVDCQRDTLTLRDCVLGLNLMLGTDTPDLFWKRWRNLRTLALIRSSDQLHVLQRLSEGSGDREPVHAAMLRDLAVSFQGRNEDTNIQMWRHLARYIGCFTTLKKLTIIAPYQTVTFPGGIPGNCECSPQ
ncbi:hypothetical protein OH77DRAFT_967606 [Trametes cingulata]|nr:hypothetical protein OH77DRAFT_967606 [Trametes cingulata]